MSWNNQLPSAADGTSARKLGRAATPTVASVLRVACGFLAAGVLFVCQLHALLEEGLELGAGLLGLPLEFVQELSFLLLQRAIHKERMPQPIGFIRANPLASQQVILERLLEEMLEGRCLGQDSPVQTPAFEHLF